MRKIVLIIFFIHFGIPSIAQINLVPNYSFEERVGCPNNASQFYRLTDWFSPSSGTPDCINECSNSQPSYASAYVSMPQNIFGYQYPLTGNGYAGLYTTSQIDSINVGGYDGREYVSTQLIEPLQVGQTYYLSFNISLADSFNYATGFGAALTVDEIFQPNTAIIDLNPIIDLPSGFHVTNKINWREVTGSFVADSAYNYIILGNFNQVSPDYYEAVNGGSNAEDNYFVNQIKSYYYLDNVCLSTSKALCKETISIKETKPIEIQIYPNPFSDQISMQSSSNISYVSITKMDGSIVYDESISSKFYELKLEGLVNGMYIVTMISDDSKTSKLIVKD